MYRIDRILCATDFSASSVEALQYAVFLARHYEAKITLLHVDEHEKSAMGDFRANESAREQHRIAVQAFAVEQFNRILQREKIEGAQVSLLVRYGTAYKEIVQEAEEGRYALVAIATQGIGCSSPHLIGRTVERVVRLCRAPVLTVCPPVQHGPRKIQTIVCPTDFSEYGNYALPYAISIARHFAARLILVHAADLSVAQPELLASKFPEPRFYHEHADEVTVERIVGRDVEPENFIVRVAEENSADLVVIGTHGARGLRRVQIGNTTEEVIRRVQSPVLSITHPVHKMVFPRRFAEDYQPISPSD